MDLYAVVSGAAVYHNYTRTSKMQDLSVTLVSSIIPNRRKPDLESSLVRASIHTLVRPYPSLSIHPLAKPRPCVNERRGGTSSR